MDKMWGKWCLGQFTELLNVIVETGWDTAKLSPFSIHLTSHVSLIIKNREIYKCIGNVEIEAQNLLTY